MKAEEFDCRVCGACCCHRWSWPVLRRDRSDAVGIPVEMVREDLPLMRTVGDRCVALEGVVGVRCGCAVYPVRPEACRGFVPGGVLCLEAREKRKEKSGKLKSEDGKKGSYGRDGIL
jgi:Fe-S-cluster containining protein